MSATEGTRHYRFDSADRLVCIGSTSGNCNLLSVIYDSSGERLYEAAAGGITRVFLGDDYVSTHDLGAPSDARTVMRWDVFAFGERVAFVSWKMGQPQAAAPWIRPWEAPSWLVALLVLAPLSLGLALALQAGLLVGVARRPGAATLSLVLIAAIAVPFRAGGGGGGGPVSAQTFRWTLSDPLGSAVAVIDEGGTILRHTRFKPFGGLDQEFNAPSTSEGRRTYAGHPIQEDTTGLTYMKARWMDSKTGTFLSVDPLHARPGARALRDPQQINSYSYARNNPVSITDPTGEEIEVITITARATAAAVIGTGLRGSVTGVIEAGEYRSQRTDEY